MNQAAYEANKKLVLHMRLRYGSQSFTTSVSLLCPISIALARELGSYQSNYVIHEAMNSSICLLLLAGSHAIITPGSVNLEF